MLGLAAKTLVAIEAVLDIAFHAADQPVQACEITARQNIPRRSLEPVLQQLTRAGVLTGVRGPRGGYRLARERRRLSVGEIVRAISGADEPACAGLDPAGSELGQRVVRPLLQELAGEVLARLESVSVDDLCLRARQAGLAAAPARILDYTI